MKKHIEEQYDIITNDYKITENIVLYNMEKKIEVQIYENFYKRKIWFNDYD